MFIELVEEWDADLHGGDPLGFPCYHDRLVSTEGESVRTGRAVIDGVGVVLVEGDFAVVGGSMGVVHGEKVLRAYDRATEGGLPVVAVTRSGGARMQEGMVALVQLARTAAAAERHRRAGLLSIAVHLSPTTGGVLASYGSLTDLRVAEQGATIGFAGPRVVAQTTGSSVEGISHSAETAYAAGIVDSVVAHEDLHEWVAVALGARRRRLLVAPPPAAEPSEPPEPSERSGGGGEDAWAAVCGARRVGRPTGVHVASAMCSSWTELAAGTDPVVRVGLAELHATNGTGPVGSDGEAQRAVVIALDRYSGDGRPTPEGFRKAGRGIALAGRLGLPIVAIVDTPGAQVGPEAENDGVAREIAEVFAAMASVPVPTVAVCVGEGGSGGALAFAAADRLLVQRGAVFSVIGPEGAAAILERDAGRASEVAPLLGLTSADLLRLGVVDAVVPDEVDATVHEVAGSLESVRAQGWGRGRRERFDAVSRRWTSGD